MKPTTLPTINRRRLAIAVAGALTAIAAMPASAEELLSIKLFRDSEVMFRESDMSRWTDNYVELGVGYNSRDSLRFGQFSGLTDQGGFPLAGFNWISRDQSNDAEYWRIHGANLGLDSRKLQAEGGVQGKWTASFSFDGLKKSQTDTARFIYSSLSEILCVRHNMLPKEHVCQARRARRSRRLRCRPSRKTSLTSLSAVR